MAIGTFDYAQACLAEMMATRKRLDNRTPHEERQPKGEKVTGEKGVRNS
jgi:hypothetical protein